ncbi:MAG: DUF255 domain-containing protein [Verrucomicrobiota bacterium]
MFRIPIHWRLAMALAASLPGIGIPSPARADEKSLEDSPSPFVQSFVGGSVRWMPWGDAAFQRAKAEEKPLFVYLGYTGCYWCERMRVESFEGDEEVVTLLNDRFVPVILDKDIWPGLNNLFTTYADLNRSGTGWPMCVWLTPELNPFSVGGYFGNVNRQTKASLFSVLEHVDIQWRKRADYIRTQSERDLRHLQDIIDRLHTHRTELDAAEVSTRAVEILSASFDPVRGGFNANVGFPNPSALDFLAESLDDYPPGGFRDQQIRRMLLTTVENIVHGGLYDQFGDGFFRYTTDSGWQAPSFEKDLVTQARMASSFIRIANQTDEEIYSEYAIRVIEFVLGNWKLPSGLFAHGLDSFSEAPAGTTRPRQGAFYTWTADELEALLTPAEREAFFAVFSIKPSGNLPLGLGPQQAELVGLNVPRLDRGALDEFAPELLASAMQKVNAAREKRSPPLQFDAAFTGANALFLSALATGGVEFRRDDFLHAAAAAGDTLWSERFDNASAKLYHDSPGNYSSKPAVNATDYSCFIAALLDLHDATGERKWLERATRLQDAQLALFWDVKGTGIHEMPEGARFAPFLTITGADRVLPAANTLAILNLVKLYRQTENATYLQRAEAIIDLFSGRVEDQPLFSLPLLRGIQQVAALKNTEANP